MNDDTGILAPKPTIRRAKPGDLLAVARIYCAAFPDSLQQLGLHRLSPQGIADVMRICLVAEPQGFFIAQAGSHPVCFSVRMASRVKLTRWSY